MRLIFSLVTGLVAMIAVTLILKYISDTTIRNIVGISVFALIFYGFNLVQTRWLKR